MSGIKGVSKQKVNKKGVGKGKKAAEQQSTPIPLPTAALAEIFKWMPRPQRFQLAQMSSQTAEVILPGLEAEHQKVSSILSHLPHPH